MAGGYVNGIYYPSVPAQGNPSRTTAPAAPAGSEGVVGSPGAAGYSGGPPAQLQSEAPGVQQSWGDQAGQNAYRQAMAQYQQQLAQRNTDQGFQTSQFQTGANRATSMLSGLNFTSPGGGIFPAAGAPLPSQVPPPQTPGLGPVTGAADAAQTAAFGKAKATAGSLGESAVRGLQDSMADRGILGSGVEARGLVDRLAAATNPLSDLNIAGLHENVGIAEQNQQLQQQSNLAGYQGGITERGQDIQAQEAAAQRALAQQQMQQNLALQMLQGLQRFY